MEYLEKWLDGTADYSVLKYIRDVQRIQNSQNSSINEKNNRLRQMIAVLNILSGQKHQMNEPLRILIDEPPGSNYDLYKAILKSNPVHNSEVWCSLFDRELTTKQRYILCDYKWAYSFFYKESPYADKILRLAVRPVTGNFITTDMLYSKEVLRNIMSQ